MVQVDKFNEYPTIPTVIVLQPEACVANLFIEVFLYNISFCSQLSKVSYQTIKKSKIVKRL